MREKDEFDKVVCFQETIEASGAGRDPLWLHPSPGMFQCKVLHSDTGSDPLMGCKVPLMGLNYPLQSGTE